MPEHGQLKVFIPSLIGDGRGVSAQELWCPYSPLHTRLYRGMDRIGHILTPQVHWKRVEKRRGQMVSAA